MGHTCGSGGCKNRQTLQNKASMRTRAKEENSRANHVMQLPCRHVLPYMFDIASSIASLAIANDGKAALHFLAGHTITIQMMVICPPPHHRTPPHPSLPLTNISKRLHRQRHTRTFCATPHNWAIYTIERIYACDAKRTCARTCTNERTDSIGRHPIRTHAHQALIFP